jgi:outer membrane protein
MKKAILIVGLVASLIACNKNEGKSGSLKTAYIDTAEILEKYDKFKAEDEKFKILSISGELTFTTNENNKTVPAFLG